MPERELALDAETMRAMGHRTVDALVEMLCDERPPALRRATPAEMAGRVAPAAPAGGRDFDAILGELRDSVLPYMSRLDHPGYFAFIPACGTWPGALGDLIASALNIYAGSWMESAGPSRLELVVMDWFKDWIGYPRGAAGLLLSGGSAANLTALACAREARRPATACRDVVYLCDQAHSSLARSARVLGFGSEQVRVLPTDARHRMRVDGLAAAIDADLRAGRRPLAVVASAGSTSTGAVDDLVRIAKLCRQHGTWLHVDGAYGAFAALTERGRAALHGLELADSVTLDPHKWLYQPFECGALLVRDGALLRDAFEILPDYLRDAAVHDGEVNFCDLGLQLSRSCRALKVWCSLQYFGLDAFRAAIDRCLDLAHEAERHIAARPELELMSPAQLGIVCFRRRGRPDEDEDAIADRNAELVAAFAATGDGLVSSTRLLGRYAIRLCVMNHTSTARDVARVLDWFVDAPAAAPGPLATLHVRPRPDPRAPIAHGVGLLDGRQASVADLAGLELLAGLPPEQLDRVAGWARVREIGAGTIVIRAWDSGRDFFVVLEGAADVEHDGRHVARRTRGEFFGELAALDWGAGYGRVRSATVRARGPLRLLVLASEHLNALMASAPSVAESVQRAVCARLAAA